MQPGCIFTVVTLILKWEGTFVFETFVSAYSTTHCNNSEHHNLNAHHHEKQETYFDHYELFLVTSKAWGHCMNTRKAFEFTNVREISYLFTVMFVFY